MDAWLKQARLLEDAHKLLKSAQAAELTAYRLVPESERPPGWGTTMPDEILFKIFLTAICDPNTCAAIPTTCTLWARIMKVVWKTLNNTERQCRTFTEDGTRHLFATVRGGLLLLNSSAIQICSGKAVKIDSLFVDDAVERRVAPNGSMLVSCDEYDNIAWTSSVDGSVLCSVSDERMRELAEQHVGDSFNTTRVVKATNFPGVALVDVNSSSVRLMKQLYILSPRSGAFKLDKVWEGFKILALSRDIFVCTSLDHVSVHNIDDVWGVGDPHNTRYNPKEDDTPNSHRMMKQEDVYCAVANDDGSITLLCAGKTGNTMMLVRVTRARDGVTYKHFASGIDELLLRERMRERSNMWKKNFAIHGDVVAFMCSNWCVVINAATGKQHRFELPSAIDPMFRNGTMFDDTKYRHSVSIDAERGAVHIAVAKASSMNESPRTVCRVYTFPCAAF